MQHHHAATTPRLPVRKHGPRPTLFTVRTSPQMDELDRRMNAELNAREHLGHMPYQLDLHTIEPMPRGRWELTYDLYELLGMLRLLSALCRKARTRRAPFVGSCQPHGAAARALPVRHKASFSPKQEAKRCCWVDRILLPCASPPDLRGLLRYVIRVFNHRWTLMDTNTWRMRRAHPCASASIRGSHSSRTPRACEHPSSAAICSCDPAHKRPALSMLHQQAGGLHAHTFLLDQIQAIGPIIHIEQQRSLAGTHAFGVHRGARRHR